MDQQINPQIPPVPVKTPSKVLFKIKPTLNWLKAHKIVTGVLIAATLLIGYLIVKNITKPTVSYVTEKAVRMNLKQTISATGKVDSDSIVDLQFSVAGEVEKVNVQTGDPVLKDQVLVSLKHEALSNQISEAQAALNLQKANYLKVASGAKREEVLISLRKVDNAQVSYDAAIKDFQNLKLKLATDLESLRTQVKNLTQTLVDTKISTDLEVLNAKMNLLTTLNVTNTKSSYSISQVDYVLSDSDLKKIYSARDYQAMVDSKNSFDAIGQYLLTSQQDYLTAINSQNIADIIKSVDSTTILISKIEVLLKLISTGLNATTADAVITDSRLINFKTIIKTEQDSNTALKIDLQSKNQIWISAIANQPIKINVSQANLDNANASLNTAIATNAIQITQGQTKIDTALAQLNLAKAELALTQSRATSSDLAIAQAQVDQAQSSLDRLNTQLKDYQIIAPFDGIVGKINVKENQTVTQADVIASVTGAEQFKIEVDIPESDIIKISTGNPVELTLDAYSSDVGFTGHVERIDTVETLIADVVYYKVEVILDPSTSEIKQGMSANLDILANKVDNALVVPARAVLENPDGTKYVRVLNDGQVLIAIVKTGLRGDEGKIEIKSGLMEGDMVITFEKKL